MDKSQADAAVMAQVATRFDEVRDELQRKLDALRTIVDGVRADWQGAAGNSFQNVTNAWTERQTDLINTLTQTGQGIRDAGKFYAGTNDGASHRMTSSVDLSALAGTHHTVGGAQ